MTWEISEGQQCSKAPNMWWGHYGNEQTYLRQEIKRNWQADFWPFSSLVKVEGKERERSPGHTSEWHKIHAAKSHLSGGEAPCPPDFLQDPELFWPGASQKSTLQKKFAT